MGVLVGLGFGCGLLLIIMSGSATSRVSARRRTLRDETAELLATAGVEQVTPQQLAIVSGGVAFVAALIVFALTQVPAIAVAFGAAALLAPRAVLRSRARTRRGLLRELWPDVVDNLSSAVRAGLSLPEALSQLAVRGPETLRPAFRKFGEDYRASGTFGPCLDRLEAALADPTADRVCETLRMAREVGGSDVGTVLRTLSTFLREDARTRAELETRQGWTVNAARLALCSPWLVLVLLAGASSAVTTAYNRPAGAVVLAIGAVASVVAYRVMVIVGRLPEERRVLRRVDAPVGNLR